MYNVTPDKNLVRTSSMRNNPATPGALVSRGCYFNVDTDTISDVIIELKDPTMIYSDVFQTENPEKTAKDWVDAKLREIGVSLMEETNIFAMS